jgi:Fur family ferric uptake transcriptional regulator
MPHAPQTSSDFSEALRAAGIQVTAQRLAVHRAISRSHHATSEAICEQVRAEIGAVSKQAVYDALRMLTEHGFIRRIEPAHSPARYEARVDNHHHLICRNCGTILDVECAKGKAPCIDPVENHGFQIMEAEVIYWGICPQCQSTS